jgi:AcrR family transcriptional regulator
MSPRPRKVSDETIFAAAQRVMGQLGPAQWTLADIAREAGLTAGAVVHRFGSKRDLLLAMMEGMEAMPAAIFSELRSKHRSPLKTLRAYADCVAQMGDTPGTLAHHLSYLQLDIADPDFNRHMRAQSRATRAQIRALLDESVAQHELKAGTNTTALARAVEVTLTGSLFTWAFYQEGSAAQWIRHDLQKLLEVHLPKRQIAKGSQ